MSSVLTESSIVKCAHQGSVQLVAGQSKLTVNGSKVLVDGDLNGKTISGCVTPTNPDAGNKTCLIVSTTIDGVASKLKVNGKGVLLENINGQTDGTVGGTLQNWSVQNSGQTKLKAL